MTEPSDDFPFDTVAIVGVGFMGGSLAAALKKRNIGQSILGVGRSAERLKAAQTAGLIDAGVTDLKDAGASADLLIFCTPVDRIVDGVREAAAACRAGTLITDVGSIKVAICNELGDGLPDGVSFVGSHPLAGSEKTGFEHADADLFEGRVCVVTPSEEAPQDKRRLIADFWRRLGMTVIEKTPEEHDRLLAVTSHLPHIVASALATLLEEENRAFAASGFRDTTRIAGSDPDLWTAIIDANAGPILEHLERFQTVFQEFRIAIEQGDSTRLQSLLQVAKTKRDQLKGNE